MSFDALLTACEQNCVAECCGVDAFEPSDENVGAWLASATADEVAAARGELVALIEGRGPQAVRGRLNAAWKDSAEESAYFQQWLEALDRAAAAATPSPLSPKQLAYLDLLDWALPWVRNTTTWPWWRRGRDRSAGLVAQLVHGLPVLVRHAGVTRADIWFLNHQARQFVEHPDAASVPFAREARALIRVVFTLVPEDLKASLQWPGPADEGPPLQRSVRPRRSSG